MRTLRTPWFSTALAALVGLTAVASSALAADGPLRAGAAVLDATPFLDDPIVGNFETPPAAYVHDPIQVRALVLDDGTTRLAFAVVDSVGVSREVFDAARKIVAEKAGIPEGNLLGSATHTHSATSGRSKNRLTPDAGAMSVYQTFLARRIADAVRLAAGNLAPARIGWGTFDAPEHVFNRRWLLKPGTTNKNPLGGVDRALTNPGRNPNRLDYAGPTDPQVAFLAVKTPDGRPIAVLANYSLHYVGGVPKGHLSADYFAVFARKLGERLGVDPLHDPPFVGVMSNGTSGDVNNIDVKSPPKAAMPSYAKMALVADDLARRVAETYAKIEFRETAKLASASRELVLKLRKPTPEQLEFAKTVLAKPADAPKYHNLERSFANRIMEHQEAPAEVSVLLQAFRIGDLGIDAIPFEVFAEMGLEIKAKSPFKPTFTMELANGTYGYLPTPRHFEVGGYETWLGVNRVEPEAAPKITAVVLDLLKSLDAGR